MTDSELTADLHDRARRVRNEMGSADKVAKMSTEGDRTVREHIDAFLDEQAFREIGTVVRCGSKERGKQHSDGKIGGHGTVDGRPVAVLEMTSPFIEVPAQL